MIASYPRHLPGLASWATPRHAHRLPSAQTCTNKNFRRVTSLLWKATSSNRHLDSIPRLSGQELLFPCRTRSVTHDQLRHASLVIIPRRSFQLFKSKEMWWSLLGNAPRLRRCGEMNLSPLSPTGDVQHELFHTDSSDASCLHCSNKRISTTIVKVSTCFISVDVRLLESRIIVATVRTDTIDARSARSALCAYAIVNISALMDG